MLRHFVMKRAGEPAKILRATRALHNLLFVAIVCALLLTACGGDPSPTTAPNTSGAATATSAPAAATSAPASSGGGVVELKYSTWGSPQEQKAQKAAADSFNAAHPNIHVSYLPIPSDYETKITTMYAGKQEPDVYLLGKVSALQWAVDGKIANLKPYMDSDPDVNEAKLIPNAVMRWAPDKILGTKATEEAFALWYNRSLFEAAGMEVPPAKAEDAWTWDKFVEVAQKLTLDTQGRNALDPNFDAAHIKQYGATFEQWAYFTLFPSSGASIISADGSKLTTSDATVVDSVQKLSDLINKYHVAPNSTTLKTLPSPALSLASGKVAMNLDGQWVQVELGESKANWDVGVMPKINNPATLLFGEALVMSSTSKHPKEAWEFYKWMVNPSSVLELYSSGLWMPIVKEWYEKPELIAKWADVKPGHTANYKTAVMDMATQHGVNADDYYLKNAPKIYAVLTPALDPVWLGKQTAADALKGIESKVQPLFQGVYTKR